MIYGVGIDLLDFSQVNITNKKLLEKVLTDEELKIFATKTSDIQRMNFFAGRFAAKEAYVKALGTGFRTLDFRDIEVVNNDFGQPIIKVLQTQFVQDMQLICHVSISHSNRAATAVVILEQKEV